MSNPLARFNPNNPMRGYDFGALRNMYQSMRGGNPMQMIQQMAASNPQMRPIVQALNQGANPQQIFASMCQQRGINPQEFMRQLTGQN